jgi:hypothetical protein
MKGKINLSLLTSVEVRDTRTAKDIIKISDKDLVFGIAELAFSVPKGNSKFSKLLSII